MAEKHNSICAICGNHYYKCLACRDLMALSPWKIHTDTSEHYKIYQILHGYSTGVYSKDEAKLKLQMVDLSDLDSFREHIKMSIKDILKDVEAEEKLVIDTEISDENTNVKEKVKTTRKRKSSKLVETE